MASHPNYVKQQLAVDTVSWTPIVAPMDCMGVGIRNTASADLLLRSDAGNPATQDRIAAGMQEGILVGQQHAAHVHGAAQRTRFTAGETIAYLQTVSGTGPAVVTFVR